MGLPPPWRPAKEPIPLIIYGDAGAVGSFAIKLAQASNIHPLMVTAGNSMGYVETLITREKGASIIDYRLDEHGFVDGIQKALKCQALRGEICLRCITGHMTFQNISKVLANNSKMTLVLPNLDFSSVPEYIKTYQSTVGSIFQKGESGARNLEQDFGFVYFRWFGRALKEGLLTGHPFEIVSGGLRGVEKGLKNLKEGKNSVMKAKGSLGHRF